MTVRIINPAPPSDEIRIFWRVGKEPFVEEKWQDMRGIFAQQSKANAKIVALLKIDRTAKYKYMVDIIDQLQFAELNRFSLAPLDEKEKAEQLKAIQ
jgi:biopolymer transport protein ExbD